MNCLLCICLIVALVPSIQGQCSGGIWPVQDASIGSFTVSWRHNIASNTVQFIIQGQAATSISLASTYIALGWSDTAPTMSNMDVAMYFVGTQIVQDRFSRAHVVPVLDSQQDFCVIQTNVSGQNVYVSFERFVTTGDPNDISYTNNVFLMFALGSFTPSVDPNNFNPQYHKFHFASQTNMSLLNCLSVGCLNNTCTTASCPCLQQTSSGAAQCVCFPPSPCVSGSTITPSTTLSTPTRTAGTSLVSTTTNVSCQSSNNPCLPNGACLQTSPTQVVCICSTGYTGTFCQTPLLTTTVALTVQCQCVNGGTCLPNGTCVCSNAFSGKFCQLNNPCSNYCRNNGLCSVTCTDSSCGTPNCSCPTGFAGLQCDPVLGVGVCQSNPCVNGICTVTVNGSYQCLCTNGFSGTRCDVISSCLSSPCNQGTCVISSNCVGSVCGYSCSCPNGTSGMNCEIGLNACWSAPCRNGGICSPLSNAYLCQCPSSFGGTNCDLPINVCTPNPCLNSGVCLRNSNTPNGTYQCLCVANYIGARCEFLSGCISSPCRNGGQCLSSASNCNSSTCIPTCACPTGFTGVFCEQQYASCATLSCLNGGTCLPNPLMSNASYCQCPSSYTGARCETPQSGCSANSCRNNGVCYIDASSGNSTARCLCLQGFTGQFCQSSTLPVGVCTQNPCGLNGTCVSVSNSSYYCSCLNGVTGGPSCSTGATISCANSPCRFLSTCQTLSTTNSTIYRCVCPDYLTGDRCQYTNSCQKQPCFNQGTCIPLGPQNSFICTCPPGFGNFDCSTNLGVVCTSSVCLNGGTCQSNSTSIQCICPSGFAGGRCEWTAVCSASTCQNGGVCRQTASTMVECLCPLGFTGPTCAMRDSCTNFPCKSGAGCASLLTDTGTGWSAYRCSCPTGTFGQNCDTAITSCANFVCPTFQICSEQPTGPVCTCSGNKVGTFCQYDNPCGSSSTTVCSFGGTCVSSNTDPPIASCLCRNGFTGPQCMTSLQSDICASNPCLTRGVCALSLSNTSYTCVCQASFVGDQCERSNPCLSSPCLNQAVCQPMWNATSTWCTCRCVGTFTGTLCETSLLNPCSGLCMNGSPCVNGTCVCPAQYTGTFCGLVNPCFNSICRNGGFCLANFNATNAGFTCTCLNSFTGQYCETVVPVQPTAGCLPACLNGGSCVSGVCMCTSQYVGPSCQFGNPCITRNPCLNSGTCFGRYNANETLYTQCFCLQGYTGDSCETTLCSLTACNGGVCLAAQNTFVCTCPAGKVGDRCQYADACANNPCAANQRCDQTGSQYQCTSCFDRSTFCSVYQNLTQYCNNRYTLLINNTYVPVLQACQRSCGQCTSNQQSNNTRALLETIEQDPPTATDVLVSQNIPSQPENCLDQRDDCQMQKTLGFCEILNERFPDDCMKTCHPDCVFHT